MRTSCKWGKLEIVFSETLSSTIAGKRPKASGSSSNLFLDMSINFKLRNFSKAAGRTTIWLLLRRNCCKSGNTSSSYGNNDIELFDTSILVMATQSHQF